jgi:hypothetical protein
VDGSRRVASRLGEGGVCEGGAATMAWQYGTMAEGDGVEHGGVEVC